MSIEAAKILGECFKAGCSDIRGAIFLMTIIWVFTRK